jgi:hypothetical protein
LLELMLKTISEAELRQQFWKSRTKPEPWSGFPAVYAVYRQRMEEDWGR